MSNSFKGELCAMTLGLLAFAAGAQEATAPDAAANPAATAPATSSAPAETAAPTTSASAPTAKPAAQADDENPAEVIVTARRVEEKLQDVPISITVYNQETLSNQNVVSATDLANITPSLASNNNFGNENTTFAIRGFVQDAGTSPSVGTYFGDVVAPRGPTQGTTAGDGVGPGSFFDLQNVQVLKGPQGTLFGRNTTGGAVLLVPQKPTANTEGYAEVSVGNYNMRRAQGVFNTPFSDIARFRLAIDHQTRDGYLDNKSGVGPDNFNDIDYDAVRASLVLDLAENVENYTIGSYSHSDTNGSVQKLIACDSVTPGPLAGGTNLLGGPACDQLAREKAAGYDFHDLESALPDPVSKLEQWQLINTTTWTATDELTVKNIASYAQFRELQRSALFGTNLEPSATNPLPYPPMLTAITAAPGARTADQATYTEEIQLQGAAFDSALTYQSGIYLEWSDPLNPVGNLSPSLITCSTYYVDLANCTDPIGTVFHHAIGAANYTVGETTYRTQGVYTQATYAFNDQFKMTGGARYTWDKQENESSRISYRFVDALGNPEPATPGCTDPAAAMPDCRGELSKKSSAPTWMIDFDYTPTQDILTYAKYARGYRAGGVYANAPSDLRTFDPEKVDNFEIGLKTSFDKFVRGTFNVAAFYNDFSDQQIQAGYNPAPGAPVSQTAAIVNAGKSRIWGAEVESTLIPAKGLTFQLSYTYLNAEIREIDSTDTTDPNYVAAVSNIAPGSPLVLSPKNKYSLSGNYKLPLDSSVGVVSFGLTFVHTDKQLSNYSYLDATTVANMGGNFGELKSTNLLNANINWDQIAGTPIDLSIFGTNLTDEQYYNYIPGLAQSGMEFATVAEPRMYGMRLRYSFGN